MTIRALFSQTFGEKQTCAIEAAAREHGNGVNNTDRGTDPFKWALLIAIGYECMSKEHYREYHGITIPWETLRAWIKQHGELGSHDGDCDYLAAIVGAYDEFISRSLSNDLRHRTWGLG